MKPLEFIKNQYLWSKFKKEVLPELTNEKAPYKIKEYILPKRMTDSEIQKETNSKPINVKYFASILQETLQDKNKWYLFHVQLKDSFIAVRVCWDDDEWALIARDLDDDDPWDGYVFFSPATDSNDTENLGNLDSLNLKIKELETKVDKLCKIINI